MDSTTKYFPSESIHIISAPRPPGPGHCRGESKEGGLCGDGNVAVIVPTGDPAKAA